MESVPTVGLSADLPTQSAPNENQNRLLIKTGVKSPISGEGSHSIREGVLKMLRICVCR